MCESFKIFGYIYIYILITKLRKFLSLYLLKLFPSLIEWQYRKVLNIIGKFWQWLKYVVSFLTKKRKRKKKVFSRHSALFMLQVTYTYHNSKSNITNFSTTYLQFNKVVEKFVLINLLPTAVNGKKSLMKQKLRRKLHCS